MSAPTRPVYPYSLIKGGIVSDAEFQKARVSDPVLRNHYAGIGKLHSVLLREARMRYASYRRGMRVYWTAAPVRVAAGDVVFEDDDGNEVRGRCGNRLSESSQLPSEANTPDLETPTDLQTAEIEAEPETVVKISSLDPGLTGAPFEYAPNWIAEPASPAELMPEGPGTPVAPGELRLTGNQTPAFIPYPASLFGPSPRALPHAPVTEVPEPRMVLPLMLSVVGIILWHRRAGAKRTPTTGP